MADSSEESDISTLDLTGDNSIYLYNRIRQLYAYINSLPLRYSSEIIRPSEIYNPNRLAPPASKTAVGNLLQEKVVENGGECLICLKEYKVGRLTTTMPCKHSFHSTCLLKWLSKTNSCPLCRHQLPSDDVLYEAYRARNSV